MTRPALLALSLLLAPGLAQAQESRPASSVPAGKAVADAITKLRAAKLTKRLTQPRRYAIKERGEVMILTLEGVEKGPILVLKLGIEFFSAPVEMKLSYELGADGVLRKIEMIQTQERSGKKRLDTVVATIADGMLRGERLRDNVPKGKPFELPWSENTLPAIFMWFVVPSLFDQGLPAELAPEIMLEERIGPSRKLSQTTLKRSSKPTKTEAGLLVHTFRSHGAKKQNQAVTTVVSDGPRKGIVLKVVTGKGGGFNLVSAKEYAQLKKDAPLIKNHAKAHQILRQLKWAQESHKLNGGKFASGLEALEAEDKHFAKDLEELQSIYLVLMRAAPDGSKWMAIAVPAEPGKTGKRYFVTNQEGKVHVSDTKLELDDSCAIPKGAKPLEGR